MAQGSVIAEQQLLVFRASESACALALDAVQEVVGMASLQTPPGLPSMLAGILNLRGIAVPIIRLERLFGMAESEPALHTPLMILRDRQCGLLVPAVSRIISVAPEQILETSEKDTFNGCAVGTTDGETEIIHVLSVDRILLENERRIVNEFREAVQARIAALEAAS